MKNRVIGNASKIYFTSDLHFYHKNIIDYCDRPWKSIDEMNEGLINNWNNKVPEDGIVYILGDVFFCGKEKAQYILSRLNGTKILILGNHDSFTEYMGSELYEEVHDLLCLTVYDKELPRGVVDIYLSHFPLLAWQGINKGDWSLNGHEHGVLDNKGIYKKHQMDVGVDGNNYVPLSFEEIKRKLK